jgi:translocator protein
MRADAASNRRLLSLGFFLTICFAASAAGGLLTYPTIGDWYNGLQKPAWTPPEELFGLIWNVLYGAMAVAAWLVWDRLHGAAFPALKLFAYQLALNVVWSILFFALRSPDLAAAEIVILWLVMGATTLSFWRIHVLAGWLMAPSWGWVTVAGALNIAIARSN